MSEEERVEKTWQEFWVPIVLSEDGTLNVEQVKRELSNYADVMDSVSKVYCVLTGGFFSKPNTAPAHVLDRVRELEEEDRAELGQRIEDLERELLRLRRFAQECYEHSAFIEPDCGAPAEDDERYWHARGWEYDGFGTWAPPGFHIARPGKIQRDEW